MKILLFIILLLLFFVLFSMRTIYYNRYVSRLNQQIENFTDNSRIDEQITENIMGDPKIVFNNIIGETYYIADNDCIITNTKNEKKLVKINELFNCKKIKVDSGFYDYTKNCIIAINGDLVHILCFKSMSLKETHKFLDYFKLTDEFSGKKLITGILYLNNIYLFFKDCIVKIDKEYKIEIDKNKTYFGILPTKINYVFINFLHIYKSIPSGTPTFVCEDECYIYDSENELLRGPTDLNDGFINNVDIITLHKTKKDFSVKKKGDYRIYVSGAGMKNGGYGGFLFNDIYINKKNKVNALIGTSGQRIPVKGLESQNKLREIYTLKLPYNSSCSGAGATSFLLDNKLIMVAGGGGGWSSELVKSPNFCNSGFDNLLPNNVIVIKKIVILTEKSPQNRYSIKINKFNIKTFNLDHLSYSVSCFPDNSKQNTKIIHTGYSNFNTEAKIEIIFSIPLSDYEIDLDYSINTTETAEYVNSKMIILDEQYRKKIIDNFNYVFNFKYITPKTLSKFFDIRINKYKDFNGNNKANYKYKYKPGVLRLSGGDGGGGNIVVDKNKFEICCGGGGGYSYDNGINNKNGLGVKNTDVSSDCTGASGGRSYIDKINYNSKFSTDDLFVNDFNHSDGYIVLHKINTIKLIPVLDNSNNDDNNNATNDANNSLNTFNFVNKNIEPFFSNYSHKVDFSEANDESFFEKKETKTGTLILFRLDLNIYLKKVDQLITYINSDNAFDIYIIGWNENNFNRTIVNDTNNYYKTDNLAYLDHGHKSIKQSKMQSFLEKLLQKNIYKFKDQKSLKSNTNLHLMSELVRARHFSEKKNGYSEFSDKLPISNFDFSSIYYVLDYGKKNKGKATINYKLYDSKKVKLENNKFYKK